jgi:hypothetical protein
MGLMESYLPYKSLHSRPEACDDTVVKVLQEI